MQILKSQRCFLRALEQEDLEMLYELENNEDLWQVSDTYHPFSKFILKNFINNASQDIYATRQYRFVIENYHKNILGCVDLYNFDPYHQRVCLGVALLEQYRGLGYGYQSVKMAINYCFVYLKVQQVCVYVSVNNSASRKLFERLGFIPRGTLKSWIRHKDSFTDVVIYQKMNEIQPLKH